MEETASPVTGTSLLPASKRASGRVPAACQRCRQQKLKCDVQRPCTLCVRSGVTCAAPARSTVWKVHDAGRPAKRARRGERPAVTSMNSGGTCRASPLMRLNGSENLHGTSDKNDGDALLVSGNSQLEHGPWSSNSASIQYIEEAFQQHETTSPDAAETSAFAAPQQLGVQTARFSPVMDDASQRPALTTASSRQRRGLIDSATYSARAKMLSVLPTHDVAVALVNNYFERIHWFVLVFHQRDFRQKLQALYDELASGSERQSVSVGFVGVFIAVCILSFSYMEPRQTSKLSQLGGDAALLQVPLLETLRSRLLDIAADGSIESVQTCVLLGSYYVYHGLPQLAWPICGLALRVAQALKLHRYSKSQKLDIPDLDDPIHRAQETRKRCWWAVYEMETFCSMLYGYPLSINDNDCDVELLHQYPERSADPAWAVGRWRDSGHATLLSYKVAMAQLSIIVRAALLNLYSLNANNPRESARDLDASHRMRTLTRSVAELDTKLDVWASQLPQQLHIDQPTMGPATPCKDYLTGTPGSCANACFHYLFPLQSLSLKLAFENARILIHRPLLSYRMALSQPRYGVSTSMTSDPCQASVQVCQNAALQISIICSLPLVKDAGATYAVAFICLHLLTAAITLSILAILNSMTQASHDCKMGLRQLMEMQSRLAGKSIVAEQGFAVSKKLMSLLLEKEMKQMLDIPPQSDSQDLEAEVERGLITRFSSPNNAADNLEPGSGSTALPYQLDREADVGIGAGNHDPRINEDSSFGYYEDLTTAQALHEFEQAVLEPPNESLADEEQLNAGINFGVQDYSWIWSSNLDCNFP